MSILLNGCTTWMLTKHMEKTLDSNCTRMLQTILNKSWKQHPTKQQLYGHLYLKPFKSDKQDMLDTAWEVRTSSLVTLFCGLLQTNKGVGCLARTYLWQFRTDTGCSLEDLPNAMDDKDEWRERESGKSVLAAQYDDDDISVLLFSLFEMGITIFECQFHSLKIAEMMIFMFLLICLA